MARPTRRQDLRKLDRNFAAPRPEADLSWHDIRQFALEGKGWPDAEHPYDRLATKVKGVVREPVWELSHHCAGLCVRFVTDAPQIAARWTLRFANLAMNHMPATGVSGLDLYVRTAGQWRWTGVGRPTSSPTNVFNLVASMTPARRRYMLYLPLYNGVESVELGVPHGAFIGSPPPRRARSAHFSCAQPSPCASDEAHRKAQAPAAAAGARGEADDAHHGGPLPTPSPLPPRFRRAKCGQIVAGIG